MAGAGLVALALLALPGDAFGAAGPATAKSAFLDAYTEAQTLYRAGSYAPALAAYEKAYALDPAPEALYGMARCHHQLGHLDPAAAGYERFLASMPGHEGMPKARGYLIEVLGAIGERELSAGRAGAARAAFDRALAVHAAAGGTADDAMGASLGLGLARAEAALATLRDPDPPGTWDGFELLPPAEASTGRKRGPGVGLWIGIGAGAAIVAGTVISLVVFFTRPEPPGLGWHDAPFDL